jgi:hypothetical protein
MSQLKDEVGDMLDFERRERERLLLLAEAYRNQTEELKDLLKRVCAKHPPITDQDLICEVSEALALEIPWRSLTQTLKEIIDGRVTIT